MSYRLKLAAFTLSAVLLLLVLGTALEGLDTLRRLEVVEAKRDRWQRPGDVIRALNLGSGSTVVDLGCGSGYFALKLSSAVDSGGTVYAVDIRRLPLIFLWVPTGAANAVLMANTYHELTNPGAILNQIFQSLVSGGRLVIVDPMHTDHGELSPALVERELRRRGFDIASRDDQFTDQPVGGPWWLIIALRP